MQVYELKPYILESCHFLNIKVNETIPGILNVRIPEHLKEEFNGISEYLLTFEKSPNPSLTYVTFESFFTQKIAKLVADHNDGISTGSKHFKVKTSIEHINQLFPECKISILQSKNQKENLLLMWFKTSIKGVLMDEYLKGFQYNIDTQKSEELTTDINSVLEGIEEELLPEYEEVTLDDLFNSLILVAQKDATNFIELKKREIQETLDKEISRINEYYDLLESENQLAESSKGQSAQQEIELLKIERQNLIEQQKIKYEFKETEITIEPVAIMLLRHHIEVAKLEVASSYGKTYININGKNPLLIKCKITQNTNGPLTVTSDNLIVKASETFQCKTCEKLLDNTKRDKCKICNNSVCKCCSTTSSLSQFTFCHDHITSCSCCLETVGVDEMHICHNCNQFYCKKCTSSNLCPLCSSLAPIKGITPSISSIIALLPKNLSAKKYEYAEKGNRIILLGKGILFKCYFVVYDKKEKKLIEIQEFGIFNKKK
ncbi:hypothetical protein JQN58_19650 [Aneurinibacillus sp. BA2021]|nr:hypothetical protein [Aneurinibacillus sp. BA2021]